MKTGFIIVLYKTPNEEVERLKTEIHDLGFKNYELYFVDNTKENRGYAYGVNKGIVLGLRDKVELFVIANPDISLKGLTKKKLLDGGSHFDIWGFAMRQNKKTYYGGELDPWRMSGGLITKKPKKRFTEIAFPSGSLICIKKQVVEKVGYWDESYFLYYEEVDYCMRARKAGFRIGIDSSVIYDHFELSNQTNPLKEYYLSKNRLKFLLKFGNAKQKLYELIRSPKTIFENKKGFIFNFLTLNTSSFANKLFNFVLFIFLIKLLPVQEYGIYTLVWAHVNLLMPFLDLGTTSYSIVYLSSQKEGNLQRIFSLRFYIGILVAALTVFLAFIFKYDLGVIFLILLLLPVFFSNIFSGMLLILLSLKERLYLLSSLSLCFNFILTVLSIFILLSQRNLPSLFIGLFVVYGLYAAVNLYFLKREKLALVLTPAIQQWKKILQRSFVFVLIGFFAGLYFKIDVFLLNALKGEADVGIYSAGYKFFEALMVVPASYNIIVIPLLAKFLTHNRGLFISKVKKDLIFLGIIGSLIAVILFFLAPVILPLFLDRQYTQSIQVFRIVVFALIPLLLTSVFLNSLYVLKKAKMVVYIFLFQVILNTVLNIIFIPRYSYVASSYITVFAELINLTMSGFLFKKYYENLG